MPDSPPPTLPAIRNKGGRPRIHPVDTGPKRPRGRPPKAKEPPAPVVIITPPPVEVVPLPDPKPAPPPPEPEPVSLPEPIPPPPEPQQEVSVPADIAQRQMIDEYGELDRRMQLHAAETARYELLKKTIKSWFDQAPPDADGTVEGDTYLLHLSARERERRIGSMAELAEVIGMEKLLELATVPLGALEDLIGKTRVAALAVERRSGSRRIKAIPKHPAARVD
jgi:hypothetical protein